MTCEQVIELPDSDLLAMTTEMVCTCVYPPHGDCEPGYATWLQRQVLGAITLYQRAREGRPSPCRFFPSCSAYARESVVVHGVRRGAWLSLRRLVRCRPLGPSGVDPVPTRPFLMVSCECHGADPRALLTPILVSPTQKKGG